MKLTRLCQGSLGAALLLALLAAVPQVAAAPRKTEDQLIAGLASTKEGAVVDALHRLEKDYPTSTRAFPTMTKLLTDSRPKVRRKAARVPGVLHAKVEDADLKAICALVKSRDTDEVIDGLKSLRGLKAQSVIPQITPRLKATGGHPNIIRDACRTLAVLGDKSLILQIEPLLNHSSLAVKKDAQDAIFLLKAKG